MIKVRRIGLFVLMAIVIGIMPYECRADAMRMFYVSTSGNDDGDGSKTEPFRTVERARDEARKINANMTGDIIINILSGRYELEKEIRLRCEDSGTNGYNVIYRGIGMPEVSGARKIDGWTKCGNGVWHAKVELEFARALYVNGKPAVTARSSKKIVGNENYLTENAYFKNSEGFYVDAAKMQAFDNPEDVRLHYTIEWKDYSVKVENIVPCGEKVIVMPENPLWDNYAELAKNTARLFPTYNKGFIAENAYELLDEPGEFYYNKKTKIMYYMPRENENMNTAEILCPAIDNLLVVSGRDYENKIHNIKFEGIRFAHTSNSVAENSSYCTQQGECTTVPATQDRATGACVELNWAENMAVTGCEFFGTDLIGLSFAEGVLNSSAESNVFTDMGSAAFVLGRQTHSNFINPTEKYYASNMNGSANIMFRAAWTASYNCIKNGASFYYLNFDSGKEFNDTPGWLWKNEPWAEEKGIKSWIKVDLGDEYDISSIKLSFQADRDGIAADKIQRRNFEVLLSNDNSFGTYKTLKQYDANTATMLSISEPEHEKYRYVMLRKTVPEAFALSGIWIYSNDRKPLGERGICKNIAFKNNYIARTGTVHCQSPAVLVYYSEAAEIEHNEIYDASYTGISLGWGWLATINTTAKNNKIRYNKIDTFTQQASDGGGIYLLGNQSNTVVYGNYIKNQGNWVAGLYFDEGSVGITAEKNVIQNCANTLHFWNGKEYKGSGRVNVTDTYADSDAVSSTDGSKYFTYDEIKLFTPDKPGADVLNIIENAGMEPQYAHLADKAPCNTSPFIKGPDLYESGVRVQNAKKSERARYYVLTAEYLLNNAEFGSLPWQIDPKMYFELKEKASAVKNGEIRPGYIEVSGEYELKKALDEAYSSVHHMSLEDTIKYCKKMNIDTTEAETALNGNAYEKVLAANNLESMAQNLGEVQYIYAEKGKTSMDYKNKTAVIKFPPKTDLSQCEIHILKQGLPVYAVKLDLRTEKVIENRWKITAECEMPAEGLRMNKEEWENTNPNSPPVFKNESVCFQPWYYPYMYKKAIDQYINMGIKINNSDRTDGVSLIFGNGFRMAIKGNDVVLYKDEKAVAREVNAGFIYGSENELEISCSDGNFDVILNSKCIIKVQCSDMSGYFGIYSPNVKAEIFNCESLAEIAQNKAVFVTSFYPYLGGWENWKINDGDENTAWTVRNSPYGYRAIVDLGAQYPIRRIEYLPRKGQNGIYCKDAKVYLSNDGKAENKTHVYSFGENTDTTKYTTVNMLLNGTYRYIVVEKPKDTGDLAIAELKVYTYKKYTNTESDSEKVLLISKNMPAKASAGNTSGQNITSHYVQQEYKQSLFNQGETKCIIDLGEAYYMDYFVISSHNAWEEYRRNFKLAVSNDKNFDSYDTVCYEIGKIANDGIKVYEMPEKFKQNKYRYAAAIGMPCEDGSVRLQLNQLDIYTKEKHFEQIVQPIKISQEQNTIGVSFDMLAASAKQYKLTLAGYTKDGKLAQVISKDTGKTLKGSYTSINETFEANADYYKIMLWDAEIKPICEAVFFENIKEEK